MSATYIDDVSLILDLLYIQLLDNKFLNTHIMIAEAGHLWAENF